MRSAVRTVILALAVWLVALLSPAASAAASSSPSGPVAERSATASPVGASEPTLHEGARGAAVTRLQQRLTALGYDLGVVDGAFGDATLHAVLAFQKVQGTRVDGTVGALTWARLAQPVVPRPRYTRTAAAIEVNLSLRVVLVTRGGMVTRILDASPGKPSTPTVTGSFAIQRRVNGWDRSPLGLLWRPAYFYRGYALHGYTSVPTYAASHGCVRMTIAAMNRLWSQLYVGERVDVYR